MVYQLQMRAVEKRMARAARALSNPKILALKSILACTGIEMYRFTYIPFI